MNWIRLAIVLLAIALILLELILRFRFGFGDPLLYVGDPEIGYLLAPNQSVKRFGNRIEINEYSMRSPNFTPKPEIGTRRVLMIGDSIINGGWWTDQKDTVSEMLQQSGDSLEVLNASANSWSPRNELAYLRRFGTFHADVIVLVINTDDLFGTQPTSLGVGRDRSYPDRKPMSAIFEVVDRYLLPARELPAELKKIHAEGGDRVGIILDAIRQIRDLANQNQAKFVLAMTPLLREITSGSRDYEITARQRLTEMTQTGNIEYIDFLPVFKAESADPATLYRDHIHLNVLGNRILSRWIQNSI
ncbi:SGNH/GDSL hydrolase family protein [Leptolyngbya sp. AN03gr2]|uniref:SGNH/GDSL hydrolase family protein n=1 Tax=unclassified Leptolyngbya TaxID=2650499 RepID=UPI003D31FE01